MTFAERRLVNRGTADLLARTINGRDGARIDNRGTFTAHDGARLAYFTGARPVLINRDLLVKAGGPGTVEVGFAFANSGTVREDSGHFSFTGPSVAVPAETPPQVSFTAPEDGATVAATVALGAAASDVEGIDRVMFKVDGDTVGEDAIAPFPVDWDSTAVEDGTHTLTAVARDLVGTEATAEIQVETVIDGGADVSAPPLTETGATSLAEATAFLYTGPQAIQTGVPEGTIVAARAAVIRGRVADHDGQALAEVRVSVLDRPELGETRSRDTGEVYLAVNGGGPITLRFEREGYLPADRTVTVPWNDYAWFDDLELVPLDTAVSEIDLGSPLSPPQVARGSTVTDADGTRRAALLFAPATEASMRLPDGSSQPVDDLHVRATEFTIGADGEVAMPAELPPASGYTYAAEFSIDEAIAAGADEVQFSRPVISYTENFLDFPVGTPVPAGYYDRAQQRWVPSENGLVIAVLDEQDGLAALDTTGEGTAATPAELDALGITESERRQLATLYEPGAGLWRVPITHFTPWDFNWPWGPPNGARSPNGVPKPGDPDYCSTCEGSVIEAESQVLGEDLDIVGTGRTLHYRSNRAPGYLPDRALSIPLAGSDLPPGLERIDLSIEIAGRQVERSFEPEPNLDYRFEWDGLDAFGRPVVGGQQLTARVRYAYAGARYEEAAAFDRAFAQAGGAPLANRARGEIELEQTITRMLGAARQTPGDIGAWTLGTHHSYDAATRTLWMGDGSRRTASELPLGAERVAGRPHSNNSDSRPAPSFSRVAGIDIGSAMDATIDYPEDLDVDPDGSVYVVDVFNDRVLRSTPTGRIERIAGTGTTGLGGDGGPATEAQLNRPRSVAVAPDGSLYIADTANQRIRRVSEDGTITTVAGSGDPEEPASTGDGGPATAARLDWPESIAVARDGSVAFAEDGGTSVRRIGTDGTITRVAGSGESGFSGDGGDATEARLDDVEDVAFGADGSLYLADAGNHRIRRVAVDGTISTVVGSGLAGPDGGGDSGDGGLATGALLAHPRGVAAGPDGVLYVSDEWNGRVRKVDTAGTISTVAGDGSGRMRDGQMGATAADAPLSSPSGLAIAPNGDVVVAEVSLNTIFRIVPPLSGAGVGDRLVPSEDGAEVYRFSAAGRHLDTRDPMTGAVIERFEYDGAGRVVSALDGDGGVTAIERDASGDVLALVGPDGHRTTVTTGPGGRLDALHEPDGAATEFTYDAGGLLTAMDDPAGAAEFTYDALGRLLRDDDVGDGATMLERGDTATSRSVQLTSAEGRSSAFTIEDLPSGTRRRTTTDTSGLVTEMLEHQDGSAEVHTPDGTVESGTSTSDPRFGAAVSTAGSHVETTPGGHARRAAFSRRATLTNPLDPLSLEQMTDSVTVNGRTSRSVYDAASRTYTETSPTGRETTTTIDAQGRVTLEQHPGLAPVTYAYDARGRLVESGAADHLTRWTYDARGNVASVADGEDRTWSYTYDTADRLTSTTRPDGAIVSYTYDAAGNLGSITTPGGHAHVFTHSPTGTRTTYAAPGEAATATAYTYDRDGQITSVTRPGADVVHYDYDTAGRLAGIREPRGNTSYSYDAQSGRLAAMTAPGGEELEFDYDGEMMTSERTSGTVDATVEHAYDDDFRLTGTTIDGGSGIDFRYDDDGLLTGVGGMALTLDPASGRVDSDTLGDVSTSYGYDAHGGISSVDTRHGTATVLGVTFDRDRSGRITRRTETGADGVDHELVYGYDVAGRLTAVTRDGDPWVSYAYDANGNRTLATHAPNAPETAVYDGQDRLQQAGGRTYEYNPDGFLRRVSEQGGDETTYAYDTSGNLATVELPDGREREYVTDALDRRIASRTDGEVDERFLYGDDADGPIAELDASGDVRTRFVYATTTTVPDYMVRGERTYRLVADERGSVRTVMDVATGEVAQALEYDPYGRVLSDSAPGFQPFGFGGGLYDADTGLVRLGARDYDARSGRWLAKDPLDFGGGDSNLYAYALGDPVNLIDPSGLISFDWATDGYDAFTDQAEESGQWWADVAVNSKNPAARVAANVMGPLADLATKENLPQTALTLIPGGRIAGKLVAKCKGVRIFKVGNHGPHHTFGRAGRRKHIQVTTYRKGIPEKPQEPSGAVRPALPRPPPPQDVSSVSRASRKAEQARIRALGGGPYDAVIEAIEAALRDEDEDVRMAAVTALDALDDPRTLEPLERVLRDVDEDDAIRREALLAVGTFGEPARTLVEAVAHDRSWMVRDEARAWLRDEGKRSPRS